MKSFQGSCAHANHQCSHDDGTVNTPIEHTVLTAQRHLEVLEQEQEYEEVVNAQALFDQVSREELLGGGGPGNGAQA